MGQETLTRTLRLQYLVPSEFVTQLKKPEGISALLPDDTKKRLIVQGEREAVELLAQLVQLADVKPFRYQLTLTLVVQGPGPKRQVLEKKTVLVENKHRVVATLGGGACELNGTLHGSPGEAQLVFEARACRVRGQRREATESLQATRRLPFGKTVAIAPFSDPATGPRRDKKPTPIMLILEAIASEALGIPTR